ncbi:MAG: TrkH family potassium uptake protein [Fidelibacterota bacterium]|nr:MAG: TrkH family potassium uptake protein [Candidatus Neomarinimicrobiota bacterium]
MSSYKGIINIIALFVAALGILMIFSLLWALHYGDGDAKALTEAIIICELVGWPLWFVTRGSYKLSLRSAFLTVTLSWLIIAIFGSLPYILSGAIPTFTDAFFESLSGFTTTGSSILGDPKIFPHLPNGIESMPRGLLFWRSFTHWIGGLGIVVLGIAFLPMLKVGGTELYRAEVAGPLPSQLGQRVRETAKALWVVYVFLTGLLTILLLVGGMSIYDALCHSFGCVATGGFSTKNGSIGAYQSSYIEWMIILFMILSATNFSLHFNFLRRRNPEYHKSKEFRFYLGLILIAAGVIFIDDVLHGLGFNLDTLRKSAFTTVSIVSTTGYVNTNYESWSYLAHVILFFLLFAGGCAGSTAGGLKLFRTMLLLKYLISEVRKLVHPSGVFPISIGERIIPNEVVRNVLAFYFAYLTVFVLTSVILAATGLDMESAFSASATTLGGVGPGLHYLGPMHNFAFLDPVAKWALCGNMLLGRLEIFSVIVLFSRTYWRSLKP